MTNETNRTNNQPTSALIAILLAAAMLTAVIPGSAQIGLPGSGDDTDEQNESNDFQVAAAPNEFLFNMTSFEQRGPTDHGSWDVSLDGSDATQTTEGEFATFLVADGSQVGGPLYGDVVFSSEITAPSEQNNIFGLAFGLALPTGGGTFVDTYILDWGGEEQDHLTHTKPEGFTLYRIDGQMPAEGDGDFDDQQFACFWAKNDTNCTSADIEIIAEHTGAGTGWELGETYDLRLRFESDLVRLWVDGGNNYAGGQTVFTATGTFEPGEFGLYSFRQHDVTFSDTSFIDDVPPTFDLETWCAGGDIVNGWCTGEARFRVDNAEDLGSGVASVDCTLNGTPVANCEVTNLVGDDGEYTLVATVTDLAGNAATETVTLQQEADPIVIATEECMTMKYPTTTWCRSAVILGVESEPPSGVAAESCAVRADHLGETNFTEVDCGPFSLDGEWTLRANVTTNAGNEASGNFSFAIDSTAPDAAILSPESGTSYMNGEVSDLGCILPGSIGIGPNQFGTGSTCFASGSLDASVQISMAETNNYTSGFDRVEIWDGTKNGDNPPNVCKMETFTEADFATGLLNFTWHTTNNPCPAEPHQFVTRVLEVRVWDNAGNFAKDQFEIFVIPPFP